MEIIHILWIYPYFVYIICISWIYLHLVDIICIDNIESYLACNVHNILHIYSYSVNDWCITSFTVCNLIWFYVPSTFCLVCFVSDYKLNPNLIWIYMPPFITSIEDSNYFTLNFRFVCCIGMLYWNLPQCIHIPDKGWRLSDFVSGFLHLYTGNDVIPLKLLSKCPPYILFFVLYEFCVVCVLYKGVCVLTSLRNRSAWPNYEVVGFQASIRDFSIPRLCRLFLCTPPFPSYYYNIYHSYHTSSSDHLGVSCLWPSISVFHMRSFSHLWVSNLRPSIINMLY